MPGLSYERPDTLDQAVSLLREYGHGARLLAGGTDLIVRMRQGTVRPDVIIDTKRIAELRPAIAAAGGCLSISADTVMTDVAADERVRRDFPALAEAAGRVGNVQIRNRATLAGNICNASPAADTAPPLLVYRARIVAFGPAGVRRIPVDEFFTGPGRTTLAAGELVTAIELDPPGRPSGSAYGRITRRRGADLATVSVAALVTGTGVTRLGYGAVAPRPLLITDEGGPLADPEASPAERAGTLSRLTSGVSPVSDVRGSREYRLSMVRVLTERVLATAIARRAEG